MKSIQKLNPRKLKSYNTIATFMTKPKENKIIMDNDN